jgi:hypothetical protein
VDVKGLADDREFLMDCLYTDDTALRGVVMAKVSKVAGRTIQWKAVDTIGDRDLEIQTLRDELTGTSADAGVESGTEKTGK